MLDKHFIPRRIQDCIDVGQHAQRIEHPQVIPYSNTLLAVLNGHNRTQPHIGQARQLSLRPVSDAPCMRYTLPKGFKGASDTAFVRAGWFFLQYYLL